MASGATGLSTVIPPFVPSPSFGGGTTTAGTTDQTGAAAPKASSQPTGIAVPSENPDVEKQPSLNLDTEPKLISLPSGGQGIYQPKKTDYVSYFENSGVGGDQDIQNLMKNIHSGIRSNQSNQPANGTTSQIDTSNVDDTVSSPSQIRTPSQVEPSSPIGGGSAQTTALGTAVVGAPITPSQVETSAPIGGGENAVTGNTTTFGLQPNTVVNDDGTVDEKYYDPEDNGQTAFGYNSRDPNLRGVSLPIDVIKQSIGDYTKDPKIFQAIKNGEYKVAITNPENGQTKIVNIVDAGPARWTGNVADATFRTTQDLGFSGKNSSLIQIIGPDGANIAAKGYQPGAKAADTEVASKEAPEKTSTGEKPSATGKMSDSETLARSIIVNGLKQEPGRGQEDIPLDSPEVTKLYNSQTGTYKEGGVVEKYQEGGTVTMPSPGGIPEQPPPPLAPQSPPNPQLPFVAHVKGMETGGKIPGKGNTDKVPALLVPGEYVIPKEVVEKIGKDKLDELVRRFKEVKEKAHA